MTIGFEQTVYTAEEGTQVEVCVLVTSGTLERDAVVTLSSSDDTASGTVFVQECVKSYQRMYKLTNKQTTLVQVQDSPITSIYTFVMIPSQLVPFHPQYCPPPPPPPPSNIYVILLSVSI